MTTTHRLLVVDDTGRRIDPLRAAAEQFERQHGTSVSFRSVETPQALYERTQADDLYDGVIVDFALNSRPDEPDAGFEWEDVVGRTYQVTTGIGCLDYLRMHRRYADAPLWASTNITARHAPLYYGAAWLWFNARPLNFGDFSTSNPQFQVDAIGGLTASILSTRKHGVAAPLPRTRFNAYVEDMAAALDQLLTEDPAIEINKVPIDVFAWIAALSAPAKFQARRGRTHWCKQVYTDAATMDGVTASPQSTLDKNVLNKHHWRWNRPLQDLFKWDFAGGDRFPEWPEHDPDEQGYLSRVAIAGDLLDKFDPYTEVLGAPEPREFFTSADVYAALKRWRATRP